MIDKNILLLEVFNMKNETTESKVSADDKIISVSPPSLPLELIIEEFKSKISDAVNEYLHKGSAIFIVDFMHQLAADVDTINKQQIESIKASYDKSVSDYNASK